MNGVDKALLSGRVPVHENRWIMHREDIGVRLVHEVVGENFQIALLAGWANDPNIRRIEGCELQNKRRRPERAKFRVVVDAIQIIRAVDPC